MPLFMTHPRIARLGINRKQFIDARYQLRRHAILRTELERVEHLAPRVRPTRGVHHTRAARTVISCIAIGLQDSFVGTEKPDRTFPPATHPEIKKNTSAWSAILP